MTERETVDAFARQVAQVLQRLEAEQKQTKEGEGERCATQPTCG
jgi:hypothetical protein